MQFSRGVPQDRVLLTQHFGSSLLHFTAVSFSNGECKLQYSLGVDPTENTVFYSPVLFQDVFTDPTPNNRRSIVARVGFRGNVFNRVVA
jgi:hypothetical protein